MALRPPQTSLWRSLAGPFIVASLIFATSPARAAEAGREPIAEARSLYLDGKTLSAWQVLERLLGEPAARDPAAREAALADLLDICFRTHANACIARYVQPYLDAAKAAPPANEAMRREQARRADYYLSYGRQALSSAEVRGQILEGEVWRHENVAGAALYLRRQVLAANVLLSLDRPVEAVGRVDKILSLIASLTNPEADPLTVAWALSEVTAALLEIGDSERAYGLYRASHRFIAATLPANGLEAAASRLTQAQLLQQVGDLTGAAQAADAALTAFQAMELEPEVRDRFLAQALGLKAALCAMRSDAACARAALADHPAAKLYARGGRLPADDMETTYLVVRAFMAALDRRPDAVVTGALLAMVVAPRDPKAAVFELDRAAGLAFALPPGEARRAAILATGARLQALAERPTGVFGAWRRPGAIEQLLIAVALSESHAPDADADTNFALFQLAARTTPSFDADALTALGKAKTALERRSIHQALRLRARRDRFEREHILAVGARALTTTPDGSPLSHDGP
ncbi:MAG: hypothetical protein JWQ29_1775, partial [Phenylobacterium sp.]|nr:hypothetical protein [Phenylobacterium sp.]